MAQNHLPRAPSPPATPHFLWFPSLTIAQRVPYTHVPVVTWCSQRAGQPAHSLPLNLANKQASKQQPSKQALILSVLAIALPHRSGLYSTLAILEARWWPFANPSFEPKTHRWRPRRRRQIGRCPPKSAQFWAKNSLFSPKIAPKPGQNAQTKGNVATSNMQLDFAVSKSPLVTFNSTICPRNGPKRRQKAPKSAQCAPTPRNQERAVSWATWLKIRFRGHLVHPQPPTFCGFQASELPNETPRPPNQWSLGGAGGQPGPRTAGANGGSTRVPGAQKIHFFQSCS